MNITRTIFTVGFVLYNLAAVAQTDTSKTKITEGGQTPVARAQDSIEARISSSAPIVTTKSDDKKPYSLTVSADVRIRSELRHGYRNVAVKDTTPAFFINQRSRLNFDFKSKRLDLYASIQDARVWGQQDPREGQGTTTSITSSPTTTFPIYFFELYAEPHFNDRWSLRIGRQRIVYDNQRLFAENDWRLAGASHDAVRLIYNNKINFSTELTAAYNQSAENNFGSNYTANGFKNYKDLLVHFLNWKVSKSVIFTTISSMDGYQSSSRYNTSYQRFTSGGRIEYQSYNWYATISGYYQYGKDSSGKRLSAYYLQPEVKYNSNALSIRLGMEYLSGQDTTSSKDGNFVPLYGVAHRFNGNLDLFTTFPSDTKNGGLINPYLFFQYQKNKLTLRLENHLFYSHTGAAFKSLPTNNKYLGYEMDTRMNYKINAFTDLEFGFCWGAFTNSLVEVRNTVKTQADIDKYSKTPYWTYASIRFTPVIGKFTF